MTKALQDSVWSILPKEFQEEVKELYDSCIKMMDICPSASEIYANKLSTLEGIFGHHNLTSDAEGEEMLTISRKKVQGFYSAIKRMCEESGDNNGIQANKLLLLESLFGYDCLPEELNEDNFAKSEQANRANPTQTNVPSFGGRKENDDENKNSNK